MLIHCTSTEELMLVHSMMSMRLELEHMIDSFQFLDCRSSNQCLVMELKHFHIYLFIHCMNKEELMGFPKWQCRSHHNCQSILFQLKLVQQRFRSSPELAQTMIP